MLMCKEYKKIIEDYMKTYNIQRSYHLADSGYMTYRRTMNDIDIDLRIINKQRFVQFWSTVFCYVFEWPSDENEFGSITKYLRFDDGRIAIYDLMGVILKYNKNYIAIKYGLK